MGQHRELGRQVHLVQAALNMVRVGACPDQPAAELIGLAELKANSLGCPKQGFV